MEGSPEKFNQLEKEGLMKIGEVFELTPTQKPISFTPVGGDLEKIGINPREEIILEPSEEQKETPKTLNISFLITEKGKPINLEAVEEWCKENGWRLATGFELASLKEKLSDEQEELGRKHKWDEQKELERKMDSLLTGTGAIGDKYKGNYIVTTIPRWDWSYTLYSPQETKDYLKKIAIVKL